jgi:D-xylose transport system permease protein
MRPPLTTPETRRHLSLLISILLLAGFFVASIGTIFVSAHNISNILQQIVPLALVAIASSLVLSSGYFDLSCGSLAALVGAVAASLHINLGLSPLLAIAIALMVGALAGVWHSYWIVYRQLPSLMVTLASLILFRGLAYGITAGATIGPLQDLFSLLGLGFLPGSVGKDWPVNLSTIFLTFGLLLGYVYIENVRRKSQVALGLQVRSQSAHIYQLLFYGAMGSLPLLLTSFHRGLPLSVAVLMLVAAGVHCLVQHSRWGVCLPSLSRKCNGGTGVGGECQNDPIPTGDPCR